MNSNNVFTKFSKAIHDLEYKYNSANQFISTSISKLIKSSQRFYLDEYPAELVGKDLKDYIDLMIFPYDIVSLLIPTPAGFAFITASPLTNEQVNDTFEGVILNKSAYYGAMEVTCSLIVGDSNVFALPVIGIIAPSGEYQFIHEETETNENAHLAAQTIFNAAEYIKALFIILNLNNVKVHRIKPSILKLRLSKKKPIYDYHVLKVSGVILDGKHDGYATGHGVRSHLRRGHIRRLDKGAVWVRSTFVTGSVKGFVAKDYNVVPILSR